MVCVEAEGGGRRKKREGARRKMRQMKLQVSVRIFTLIVLQDCEIVYSF